MKLAVFGVQVATFLIESFSTWLGGGKNWVPDKEVLGSALRFEIFVRTPPAHLVAQRSEDRSQESEDRREMLDSRGSYLVKRISYFDWMFFKIILSVSTWQSQSAF